MHTSVHNCHVLSMRWAISGILSSRTNSCYALAVFPNFRYSPLLSSRVRVRPDSSFPKSEGCQ
jgi:hypothetical protein